MFSFIYCKSPYRFIKKAHPSVNILSIVKAAGHSNVKCVKQKNFPICLYKIEYLENSSYWRISIQVSEESFHRYLLI